MSMEIFKILNNVLEEEGTSGAVAQFVRSVVTYECEENSGQFRKRYTEMLDRVINSGERGEDYEN